MARPATRTKTAQPALPTSTADLLEKFKNYPGIKAVERSFENPDGPGSLPILLADEDPNACTDSGHQGQLKIGATICRLCKRPARLWYVRWVNTKQLGRVAAIRAKGLIPVQHEELLHADEIADLQESTPDGLVRSGANGTRVLYKIPLDLYNERKRRERDRRNAQRRNPRVLREQIATDAGNRPGFGSEAADAIHGGIEFSEVTHHSTIAEEIGDDGE